MKSEEVFNQIEYAVFDFDGTLGDTLSIWGRVNGQVFDQLKIDVDIKEFQSLIHGMQLRDVVRTTINRYGVNSVTQDELESIWRVQAAQAYAQSEFVPCGDKFIERLHARGIKIGIATASPAALVESFLQRFPDIKSKISCIVSCDEVGKNKPDPQVFLTCIERLGCTDLSKVAIFEDTLFGLQGAKASKCGFVIQMMTGQNSAETREIISPSLSARDYSEFLQ